MRYRVRMALCLRCGGCLTYNRILLGVLIPRLGLVISVMSRGDYLDHTRLLEDPAREVIGESSVSGLESRR